MSLTLIVTKTNNIPFDPPKEGTINSFRECFSIPILYNQVMDELIMKTHCHICQIETKINDLFCSESHYRIFNKYGYQSCVYFEKYRYCSHCC